MDTQIEPKTYPTRIRDWLYSCFGEQVAKDKVERNHRFVEEALELAQACGCTQQEVLQLVEYVFNRPVGQKEQEVGGVMTTLTSLCLAHDMDLFECAEMELRNCWERIDKIREKQKRKPKFSPLPQ